MTGAGIPVSPEWLDLRESADVAARSRELADHLRSSLPGSGVRVIHDLACGTGAMGRWLAPLLPGQQLWVVHDRDADLLRCAARDRPGPAADGAPVAVETRRTDITQIEPGDLSGAALITASALLDLMTADQLQRLVEVCGRVGCPVLLTLSVSGRVDLAPAEPLDESVSTAFNRHQRRATESGRLLGPGAVDAAIAAFRGVGAEVLVRPSPWRLGCADADLAAEWLSGWIAAACEQDPVLAAEAAAYAQRRLADARAGRLDVIVEHRDLLALP